MLVDRIMSFYDWYKRHGNEILTRKIVRGFSLFIERGERSITGGI